MRTLQVGLGTVVMIDPDIMTTRKIRSWMYNVQPGSRLYTP